MLDGRRDDLVAALLRIKRREDGRIVGFGTARGKHDLVVEGRAKQRLQALAGLFHRAGDLAAEGVSR